MTTREKAFVQGYVCAVANQLRDHGCTTTAKDCLRGIWKSRRDLKSHEIDEDDWKVILPVIRELERSEQ